MKCLLSSQEIKQSHNLIGWQYIGPKIDIKDFAQIVVDHKNFYLIHSFSMHPFANP